MSDASEWIILVQNKKTFDGHLKLIEFSAIMLKLEIS